MIDEENGLRGYLFAHDAKFLAAYVRGTTGLARATRSSSRTLAPNLPVDACHALGRGEMATSGGPMGGPTRGRAAPTPSWSDGKALFDQYRGDEAMFATVLAQRNGALRLREQRLVAARVALELTVFVVIFFLALRQHRALRHSIVIPGRRVAAAHSESCRSARATSTRGGTQRDGRRAATARELAEARDETVRCIPSSCATILDASREFSESLNPLLCRGGGTREHGGRRRLRARPRVDHGR